MQDGPGGGRSRGRGNEARGCQPSVTEFGSLLYVTRSKVLLNHFKSRVDIQAPHGNNRGNLADDIKLVLFSIT